MNFEEIEATWAAQTPVPNPTIDPATLARSVRSELRRRGRMLNYAIFMLALGVLITPLLTIVNFLHARPADPLWYWTYPVVMTGVFASVLHYVVTQRRNHRALSQQPVDSVRALTIVSLTSLEAEMRSHPLSWGWWLALLGFQLFGLAVRFPVATHGWSPLLMRAAVTITLPALVALAFWRHHRVNLAPDHARQVELLKQLDA